MRKTRREISNDDSRVSYLSRRRSFPFGYRSSLGPSASLPIASIQTSSRDRESRLFRGSCQGVWPPPCWKRSRPRFASQVERDDSDITEFFDQQVQRTNCGDRAWCARWVLRKDRPERPLNLVPAADTPGRRSSGRWKEHRGVPGEEWHESREVAVAERRQELGHDVIDGLRRLVLGVNGTSRNRCSRK